MGLKTQSTAPKRTAASHRVQIGLCLGLLICLNSWGATFNVDDVGRMTLLGEIKPGDAEQAVSVILAIKPLMKDFYPHPRELVVNSPGGDVREAIRMASFVKAAHMDVSVLAGGKGACASSCFFIYLAGQQRSASGIDRVAREGAEHSLGTLGIHRPYYSVSTGGPDAAKKQEDLMSTVADLLRQERVPQSMIDTMMAHPSNDIYWLNSREIWSLGTYRAGVEEELISKCNYSAAREREMSAREFIGDSQSGVQLRTEIFAAHVWSTQNGRVSAHAHWLEAMGPLNGSSRFW